MISVDAIWRAIESGNKVHWVNTSYIVEAVKITRDGGAFNEYQAAHHSRKGDEVLRVTCVANGFGSLLSESDVSNTFKAVDPQDGALAQAKAALVAVLTEGLNPETRNMAEEAIRRLKSE